MEALLQNRGWYVYRNNQKFMAAQLKNDWLHFTYYIALFSDNKVYVSCGLPIPFPVPIGTIFEYLLYRATRNKATISGYRAS